VSDVPVIKGAEDFDSFYQREYSSVLGLGIALSGSRQNAEELAQDAFLAAYRDWGRISRLDKPEAWVRLAVANRSVSTFRRLRTEAKYRFRLAEPQKGDTSGDVSDGLDVWNEVRRLPARQAQVIALTYFADLSRAEVAETLQCSEDTVKTHLRRARRALSERLDAPLETNGEDAQ
jgi:RNA polymerase sigma-70 factor (ECF subfamily)